MTVHNTLGNGFQEIIYPRTLAVESAYQGILFKREKEMEIYYRSKRTGKRRVHFFVDNIIMVELKLLGVISRFLKKPGFLKQKTRLVLD
jgi:GxxExxY protein